MVSDTEINQTRNFQKGKKYWKIKKVLKFSEKWMTLGTKVDRFQPCF